MIANVAKVAATAARKIPWKHVLASLSVIKDLGDTIKDIVGSLRPETKKAAEALQEMSIELSERIRELALATQIVTARVTIALVLAGLSLIVGIGCWLFVLFKHS